jgi:release factor glutamine methyltransferase
MHKGLLKRYSLEQANQVFRYLIEHVTGRDFGFFLVNKELSFKQKSELEKLIDLHVNKNKPLQYILGSVDFIDSKILVEPPILIPRSETEEWVYNLLQQFQHLKNEKLKIVDIGTGSGCIAISLAKFFANSEIFALDINVKALKLAQKNADLNGVKNIEFVESDVFSNFNKKIDLIVSNPPYISEKDYQNLDKMVKDWEDKIALMVQEEGLFIIRKIIEGSKELLTNNFKDKYPKIFLEIDSCQSKSVCDLLEANGFTGRALKDFADKDRVCIGQLA